MENNPLSIVGRVGSAVPTSPPPQNKISTFFTPKNCLHQRACGVGRLKNYTLVKLFDDGHKVKRDEQGNLSCDCKGWIFGEIRSKLRPRTCQHIEQVKGLKPTRPAKVFELTEIGDYMCYPLVPLNGVGTHIDATKIYDLFVRGYSRTTIKSCCLIVKNNSIDNVVRWVQAHGRFVLPPDYYKGLWYSWTPEKVAGCFKPIENSAQLAK